MTFPAFRTLGLTLAAAISFSVQPLAQSHKVAEPKAPSSVSDMSIPDTDAPHNWTTDQIVTAHRPSGLGP